VSAKVIPIRRAELPRVVASGVLDLEMWDVDLPAVRLDNELLLLLDEPIRGMLGEQFSPYRIFSAVAYVDEAGNEREGIELGAIVTYAGDWLRGDAIPIETEEQREIARCCGDFLVAVAFEGIDGLKVVSTSTRTSERTWEMAPWLKREVR
jgi:hypothetical protein